MWCHIIATSHTVGPKQLSPRFCYCHVCGLSRLRNPMTILKSCPVKQPLPLRRSQNYSFMTGASVNHHMGNDTVRVTESNRMIYHKGVQFESSMASALHVLDL